MAVVKFARATGDIHALSTADVRLIALAHGLEVGLGGRGGERQGRFALYLRLEGAWSGRAAPLCCSFGVARTYVGTSQPAAAALSSPSRRPGAAAPGCCLPQVAAHGGGHLRGLPEPPKVQKKKVHDAKQVCGPLPRLFFGPALTRAACLKPRLQRQQAGAPAGAGLGASLRRLGTLHCLVVRSHPPLSLLGSSPHRALPRLLPHASPLPPPRSCRAGAWRAASGLRLTG